MIRRRGQQTGDEGSALILVLMIVLFTGVVMSAVLDFTKAGLTVAPKARDLRDQDTYLQGAVDGAINSIRGSTSLGTINGPACPTFTAPAASSTGASGQTFSVTCTPLAVNGVAGGAAADQPDFAILALGSGSDGIRETSGNYTLVVDGGIYSHGVVAGGTQSKAGIEVNGSIWAEGACTGTVRSTDPTFSFANSCHYAAPGSFGDDPQYASGVPDLAGLTSLIGADTPALINVGADSVPTCVGGYATFTPGYFSVTPQSLADAHAPGCNGSLSFTPGVYYFNYGTTWTISDVVGGTRSGGTCLTGSPGVHFVFGGTSRVDVNGGNLDLCGPQATQGINGLPQRIAVYGLSGNANNNTSTPTASSPTLKASVAPTSTGTLPFVPTTAAQFIGESPTPQVATAALTANKGAELTYSGFGDVPKGSKIQTAQVRMVYTPDAGITTKVTARVGAASTDVTPTQASCASGCTVNLQPWLSGLPGATWRNLNALTLELTADAPKKVNGDYRVDGVELLTTVTAPALEPLACSGCYFFDSDKQSDVQIHGTVYTPNASWNVEMHNKNTTLFERGIILRNLDAATSASFKQLESPFSLPAGTPRGRLVLFRGSMGGTEMLRACVLYTDVVTSAGANGVRAGQQVAVRRWSLLHGAGTQSPDCH